MRTVSLYFFLLSLLFCSPEPPRTSLVFGFPTDPASLDPLFATDLVSQKLAKFIYRGLYRFENGITVQDIAKKSTYRKTNGGFEWEIEIKPATNQPSLSDIAFTLGRMRLESWPRKNEYSFISSVSVLNDSILVRGVGDISESILQEKFALPFASVLNEEAWVKKKKFESFAPFIVSDWKKGESLNLKRRTDDPKLPKEIVIQILPQSLTALYLYKKDRLDLLKLSDFLLNQKEAVPERMITKKGKSVQYVAINANNPCFDLSFRKALNFAIPRKLIIEKLLNSYADETRGPLPLPFYESIYKSENTVNPYSFDLAKAKLFLSQSKCYPAILSQNLEFRMRGDDENQAKGKAILSALEELGLHIVLKGMEKAPLYKENAEGKGDLTLLTWYIDFDSPWNFIDPLFHGGKLGSGGNRAFYKNAPLTEMIAKRDPKDTKNLENIINLLIEEAPWIYLWSIPESYLVSPRFKEYPSLSELL